VQDTDTQVTLNTEYRVIHWQNPTKLLAISGKILAIFAAAGNYFRPCQPLLRSVPRKLPKLVK